MRLNVFISKTQVISHHYPTYTIIIIQHIYTIVLNWENISFWFGIAEMTLSIHRLLVSLYAVCRSIVFKKLGGSLKYM